MASTVKTIMGTVVSTKMQKTITVLINYRKKDPTVHKVVRRSKKILVHDEQGVAKLGDTVTVTESRPLSKRKHHTLVAVQQTSKG